MGDFIVYLIPTDPTWQPTRAAAEQTAADACRLTGIRRNIDPSVDIRFFERITMAHPHENLTQVRCPHCRNELDLDWFHALPELHAAEFDTLDEMAITAPCCGTTVSLLDLDYDWPAGFSRFRINLWNPDHELTDDHLATLSATLGHELRQIHAHP